MRLLSPRKHISNRSTAQRIDSLRARESEGIITRKQRLRRWTTQYLMQSSRLLTADHQSKQSRRARNRGAVAPRRSEFLPRRSFIVLCSRNKSENVSDHIIMRRPFTAAGGPVHFGVLPVRALAAPTPFAAAAAMAIGSE